MEQLLVQANGLHMEAAFLSNTLHEFADADLEGVKPVIDSILKIREQWTEVRKTIDYFQQTGTLPEEKVETSVLTPAVTAPGVAELKNEVSRLNVNISKYEKKMSTQPEHKKFERWAEDLAKMQSLKQEIRQQIVNITYAAK